MQGFERGFLHSREIDPGIGVCQASGPLSTESARVAPVPSRVATIPQFATRIKIFATRLGKFATRLEIYVA
jgi:hypothetical protein